MLEISNFASSDCRLYLRKHLLLQPLDPNLVLLKGKAAVPNVRNLWGAWHSDAELRFIARFWDINNSMDRALSAICSVKVFCASLIAFQRSSPVLFSIRLVSHTTLALNCPITSKCLDMSVARTQWITVDRNRLRSCRAKDSILMISSALRNLTFCMDADKKSNPSVWSIFSASLRLKFSTTAWSLNDSAMGSSCGHWVSDLSALHNYLTSPWPACMLFSGGDAGQSGK